MKKPKSLYRVDEAAGEQDMSLLSDTTQKIQRDAIRSVFFTPQGYNEPYE